MLFVLFLIGLVAVVVGVAQVSTPAGFIVAGILISLLAFFLDRGDTGRSDS